MIRSIELENFKCFKQINLDFGKITLLTGANSSGKSSLIQSILLAMQSEIFPFQLGPNGKYTQMGGIREIIFNHDANKSFKINYSISGLKGPFVYKNSVVNIQSDWQKAERGKSIVLKELLIICKDISLHLLLYNDVYHTTLSIPNFYRFSKHDLKSLVEKSIPITSIEITPNSIQFMFRIFINSIDEVTGFVSRIRWMLNNLIESSSHELKNNESRKQIYPLREFYYIITQLSTIDKYFNYMNSYELPPSRTYYQSSMSDSKIKSTGEGFEYQLLKWNENEPNKMKELNRIVKKLKFAKNVKIKYLSGGRYEVLVTMHSGRISSSLMDVGFGISQILPLIIADIQLNEDSILAISQPERHLHPSLQANLADYFIDNIDKKQYIIETHSEYIMHRIRLRIVEGKLKPNDIRCYYFENTADGTIYHEIKFTKDGRIEYAPDSFFNTYMIDNMNIVLKASEQMYG